MKNKKPEISIILPCQNEAEALPFCLKQIKKTIKKNNIKTEIIVSDSSTDESPKIAKKEKVILIKHDKDGYGTAYLEAFKIAKGEYIFMADADGTYDFGEIPNFLKYLREGYNFIIGDRFKGKMERDSMLYSHKLGNPLLSCILRLFFGASINDSHCGMRAISKKSLQKLCLKTTGMEFASEIIIQAKLQKLRISEIPIIFYPAGRKRHPHLRSFRDGLRHLKLIFSLFINQFFNVKKEIL